jgi:anti-sigma factor RsiW
MSKYPCQDPSPQLADYLDGDLSPQLCTEIERHLASCKNCRIVVDTLSKTISLYQKLPQPEVPSEVQERLFKVLKLP